MENKLIKEFEAMRNMAEIKALSKVSLARPLSKREFERMMELKGKLFK
ncbi:MAG: hypothetical protein KAJ49_06010 [Arcobacteraceae bacterium]|nr:hypothetical protein [Arcobacteraceae bacterium]